MIVLLGGISVKILSIKIDGLYDLYNYDIEFNPELTFLYGENGCGKTTILNILSSIVTGKFYELYEYQFKVITLSFKSLKKDGKSKNIVIEKNKKEPSGIFVKMGEESIIINNFKDRFWSDINDDFENEFFNEYPLAKKIKNTFNYIYLPLSRYGINSHYNERNYIIHRRIALGKGWSLEDTYLNNSLEYISNTIREECSSINFKEGRANERFRKKILNAYMKISPKFDIISLFDEIKNTDMKEVLNSKELYVKTMKDIDSWDASIEKEFENFFEDFNEQYEEYKNLGDEKNLPLNLLWQYSKFIKIKEIAELANEHEKVIKGINEPKEKFLQITNKFFELNGKGKHIEIDRYGKVKFNVGGRPLDLKYMSSGEKQIFIIFASLIFGLKNNKSGIYIIYEPEASLHLKWQREFVSSILEINPNIQLIFATHSPEIVGRYTNYMRKL